jgi:hypothetical protein
MQFPCPELATKAIFSKILNTPALKMFFPNKSDSYALSLGQGRAKHKIISRLIV